MPDLREDIVRLIDYGEAPLDIPEIAARRRRHRRSRHTAVAVVASMLVGVVVVAGVVRSNAPSRVRAVQIPEATGTTRTSLAVPTYQDQSKPPPLWIEAGSERIEITTMLGCWFSPKVDGQTSGVCADGSVDPSRFVLAVAAAETLTVTSPLEGTLAARWSVPPPRHGPGEQPTYNPVPTHDLDVRALSPSQWVVALPERNTAAIYLDLDVPRSDAAHGDAYYGFEIRRLGRPSG